MKNGNEKAVKDSIKYLSLEGEGSTQCRVRGKVKQGNLISTPSSSLRASSPSRGKWTGAFTLIELLIVVLIIGILAAVAVPQYQVAVVKSRTKAILPVLSAIQRAQEVYYLNNGHYATDMQTLDVQMPADCSMADGPLNWACGKDFHVVTNTYGAVTANYCPGYNNSVLTCNDYRDFSIRWAFDHCTEENCGKEDSKGYPKERLCKIRNNSVLGTKICQSFTFN